MILILILIGVILLVAAIRDTQGDLFTALGQDVPAFGTWAAAIIALGVLGFVPGLKPVSRALLGLVLVVLIVNNAPAIAAGFDHAWNKSGKGAGK